MARRRVSLGALIAAHRALPAPHDLRWALVSALLDATHDLRRTRREAMVLVIVTVVANVAAAWRWLDGVHPQAERDVLIGWTGVVLLSLVACARLRVVARQRIALTRHIGDLATLHRRLPRSGTKIEDLGR
jgi:hypothetical protein